MSDFRVDGSLGADVASFVRSIQEARSELQGLKDDVAELNRELRDLENKTVKVKVEIDGQAEIRQLRDDLDRLSRESVKIKVEVSVDAASIDEVRADLRYIRDTANTRINLRVDVDGMAEVERLHLMIMALRGHHTIRIDVDVSGIAAATAHLAAMRTAMSGITAGEDAMADGAGEAGGGLGGMMGIILALLPLVVTLGAVLSGVAAGLVGSFATMGVGIGAFALFAMPTFKKVMEAAKGTKEEFNKLSPPMQRAVINLKDLKSRFDELTKALQPTALGVFAEALNFARAGMEQVYKVAKPAGEAIQGLLKDAAEGMMGDRWSKFFSYIAKNVGFFITNWGHAIGNFVTGIANMIRAFDPLSKFVTKGFLGMSESFLHWTDGLANNPHFKKFVDYVIANGPMVLKVIGSLVTSLVKIGIAMAPAGAAMLMFIAQLLASVAAFLQANPHFAKLLAYAIPLIGALMTLGPIVSTLASAILGLSGPALLVVAAIVAVIAIVLVWWNQCASFREFVKELFADIWASIKKWIDQIKEMFAEWLPAIVLLWNKYGESIKQYVMGLWAVISAVISGALNIIRGIVNIILGLLTGDWSRVWMGMKQVLQGVWTAIKGIVNGGIQAVESELRALLTVIGNIFKAVDNLLYKAGQKLLQGFISGIKSMIGSVKSTLGGITSSLTDWKGPPLKDAIILRPAGRLVIGGFMEGISDQIPALRSQLMSLTSGLASNVTVKNNYQPKQTGGYMAASMAGGGGINFAEGAFKIYNPAPETPSDSVNRTMTRVSRFGIFEGVGAA